MFHVNHVIAASSIGSLLAAAAAVRAAGPACTAQFVRDGELNLLEPKKWTPARDVLLLDVAPDDKGEAAGFVRQLKEAGHRLAGICYCGGQSQWRKICQAAGLTWESLSPQPIDGAGTPTPTGPKLLLAALAEAADPHTRSLLHQADDAANGDFTKPLTALVRTVLQFSDDDVRRLALVECLSQGSEIPAQVREWLAEHKLIVTNHREILADHSEPGEQIAFLNAGPKKVHLPSLFEELFRRNFRGGIVDGQINGRRLMFFSCAKSVTADLLQVLEHSNVPFVRVHERIAPWTRTSKPGPRNSWKSPCSRGRPCGRRSPSSWRYKAL